jgi:hypothetical protein
VTSCDKFEGLKPAYVNLRSCGRFSPLLELMRRTLGEARLVVKAAETTEVSARKAAGG